MLWYHFWATFFFFSQFFFLRNRLEIIRQVKDVQTDASIRKSIHIYKYIRVSIESQLNSRQSVFWASFSRILLPPQDGMENPVPCQRDPPPSFISGCFFSSTYNFPYLWLDTRFILDFFIFLSENGSLV